jgi:hypothetical protein
VQFCNQSEDCIKNFVLKLALDADGGIGEEMPGYTQVKGVHFGDPGNLHPLVERSNLDGAWPNYSVSWEYSAPHASVYFRARFTFDNCGGVPISPSGPITEVEPYVITAVATATVNGQDLMLPPLEGQNEETELTQASGSAVAALRCPATSDDVAPKNFCVLPQA